MANEQNLIPITSRTPEERRELGRKGGSVKSMKKKLAAKIRMLKKNGLNNQKINELIELMESPELTAFDRLIYIRQMKAIAGKDIEEMNLVDKRMADWQKKWHGEKNPAANQVNIQPIVINVIKDGELEPNKKTDDSLRILDRQ